MKTRLTMPAAIAAFLAIGVTASAEDPANETAAEMTNLDHIDMTAFQEATRTATDNAEAPQNQQRAQRRNTGGHSKGGFLDRYDTNGDGEVEMAEFVAE